jgi:hypothetical protein
VANGSEAPTELQGVLALLANAFVLPGKEPIRHQACAYFIAARENPTPENRRRAAHWLDRLKAARP